ncbi:Nn.00g027840.m01.CDS01 [Neocucurbitaria sp. VM-36]
MKAAGRLFMYGSADDHFVSYQLSHQHEERRADPMIEDGHNQISPLEWAWTKILGGSYEHDTQAEMEELFSDRDCLEEMGFAKLHRIVLGLTHSSLSTYLFQNPGCINTADFTGRTALSWASQRGSTDVVIELLQYGADPSICTSNGHSPLQYAASARNPGCIQPLLDAGAVTDQVDVEGQTSLHYAAVHQHDLAYYRPLIKRGADVNWRTKWKATPLASAILEGHNEGMRYLVECGADINLKTHDDRPPVFHAVEYNNHVALKFLHEKGADFTGESEAWPTIAHVAVCCANNDTLRILTSFRLRLADVDCVDRDGFTIDQIVERRVEDKPELGDTFVEAFSMFLDSITVNSRVEEEEDFYDAVEVLSSH